MCDNVQKLIKIYIDIESCTVTGGHVIDKTTHILDWTLDKWDLRAEATAEISEASSHSFQCSN